MKSPSNDPTAPLSYRDRAGHLFYHEEQLFRAIHEQYLPDYRFLLESGLYQELTSRQLLIPHQETELPAPDNYKLVIKPEQIPFISYPYEWCFSQLKDAALATLKIQLTALNHGMTLKDAAAVNIQFYHHRPVLIDTTSFIRLESGTGWIAYEHFLKHFLAPLVLSSKDPRLRSLQAQFTDGIPLDLTQKLAPTRTKFSPRLLMHLHLPASLSRWLHGQTHGGDRQISSGQLTAITQSLIKTIEQLSFPEYSSNWDNYYSDHAYSQQSREAKESFINRILDQITPKTVWDLGSNTGRYAQLSAQTGAYSIAIDTDSNAIEHLYRRIKQDTAQNLLPLVIDITAPSPGLGILNQTHRSLTQRGPADLVMALALIHHLYFSNRVPFELMARQFSAWSRSLIIEFIEPGDTKISRISAHKQDIKDHYSRSSFEQAFNQYYKIETHTEISATRRLYLMKSR